MKTQVAKTNEVSRDWYLVDVNEKVLGRVATQIANVLRGKNKPVFTPSVDTGDFVIVVNAEKVKVSGKKFTEKKYKTFSGYPSGQKEVAFDSMLKKHPTRIVELAVKRMLPHTTLGSHMYKKLKVYAGVEHPHKAQNPVALELGN